MFGTKASAPKGTDVDLLLPASSVKYRVEVKNVFPTIWETTRVTVTPFPPKGEPDLHAKAVTKSFDFKAIPWTLLLLSLLVLLALGGGLWWWLRRRKNLGKPKAPKSSKKPRDPTSPDSSSARKIKPDAADTVTPDSTTPEVPETPAAAPALMRALRGLIALALGIALSLVAAPAAQADTVPYTDPGSIGVIGLCDKNLKPITLGNIDDHPFVWRAVSSVKAPNGYSVQHGSATLLAYQPQAKLAPDQWNGDTLTAASSYTNLNYPMAQSTDQDFSLNDYLKEQPPMLNGLVQLRMYFAAPEMPALNSKYPTAEIKVSGSKWTLVRGGNVPCNKGDSQSSELLPTYQIGPPPSPTPAGSHASAGAKANGSTTSSSAGPSGSAPTSTDKSTSSTNVKDVAKKSDGGGSGGAIALLLALVVAVAGGAWYFVRQRRSPAATGEPSDTETPHEDLTD
jgi:cytoskeletal protein RodZ